MTMKKQIIYMVCATALLSSCHIYKAYDRPDTIETSGIYRDPVSRWQQQIRPIWETCPGRKFFVILNCRP